MTMMLTYGMLSSHIWSAQIIHLRASCQHEATRGRWRLRLARRAHWSREAGHCSRAQHIDLEKMLAAIPLYSFVETMSFPCEASSLREW